MKNTYTLNPKRIKVPLFNIIFISFVVILNFSKSSFLGFILLDKDLKYIKEELGSGYSIEELSPYRPLCEDFCSKVNGTKETGLGFENKTAIICSCMDKNYDEIASTNIPIK